MGTSPDGSKAVTSHLFTLGTALVYLSFESDPVTRFHRRSPPTSPRSRPLPWRRVCRPSSRLDDVRLVARHWVRSVARHWVRSVARHYVGFVDLDRVLGARQK